MGLHDVGFYDKNSTSTVTLLSNVDIFNDCKFDDLYDSINSLICTFGVEFKEYHYELISGVLRKHNIPKEKIRELRSMLGCNIRFDILD